MTKNADIRIARTRKMIFDAFIKLVNEHGFDQITIQMIADEAMINRATFYSHFKDKQDLYDQMVEQLKEVFGVFRTAKVISNNNELNLPVLEHTLTVIFEEIGANRDLFFLITEGDRRGELMEYLQCLIRDVTNEFLKNLKIKQQGKLIPNEFIFSYIISTFVGTLNWWLRSDDDFEPDHLAHFMIQLIENSHLTVLGVKLIKE